METLEKVAQLLIVLGGAIAVNGFLLVCIHGFLTEKLNGNFQQDYYAFIFFAILLIGLDLVGGFYLWKNYFAAK